ncbi:MAG: YkgJ family cysteine cluster protein [Gammaproteobacteria bacterium]|nr:YkgJ family cysteine cluster protein [Gammaproteobacteria bacterium]MBU1415782.1 YkgJ family cysteine cluster protein [Gammaproteobacteria bacterium]
MSSNSQPEVAIPGSPVVPKMVGPDHVIQFSCHKGIGCWNACCSNIDISLTPYDIIRLKKRLGISSTEFLKDYTVPYEMEKDGIAGVKFRPVENGTACRFMKPEGCSVYEDRPTACRYYPVALLSMRKQDEFTDTESYALVKEDHCKGHDENRRLTIADYRKEQGVEEYDELTRGWRQLVLKKKSAGPAVGAPSLKSRQLFFLACYDVDTFRAFVDSEGFSKLFKLGDEEKAMLMADDVEMMQFAFRFLKQVLFGENTIERDETELKQRLEKWRERQAQIEREAAERLARLEDGMYEATDEEVEASETGGSCSTN